MAKIINGNELAEKIKDKLIKEIIGLKDNNIQKKDELALIKRRPNLAIILIGGREDSKLYVKLKEIEAKKIGIDTHTYRCPENTNEEEILEMIKYLNKDELIDAILVQLPLPKQFNTDKIIKTINPEKDVDRFHPENLKKFLETCNHKDIMPPVIEVILEILKTTKCEMRNKHACIISNSKIFGKTIAKALKCIEIKTEVSSTDDPLLKNKSNSADILITAIGRPKFIKKDMVKKNAIIIDIGISKKGKKIYGDVDFKNVKEKVKFITPVPGGVGPMTIAMLFKNTFKIYKKNN